MAAVKLMANRDAIRLILDSLGLDDECITSLSINGKEIINLENLSENIEITVSKLIVNKGSGG